MTAILKLYPCFSFCLRLIRVTYLSMKMKGLRQVYIRTILILLCHIWQKVRFQVSGVRFQKGKTYGLTPEHWHLTPKTRKKRHRNPIIHGAPVLNLTKWQSRTNIPATQPLPVLPVRVRELRIRSGFFERTGRARWDTRCGMGYHVFKRRLCNVGRIRINHPAAS